MIRADRAELVMRPVLSFSCLWGCWLVCWCICELGARAGVGYVLLCARCFAGFCHAVACARCSSVTAAGMGGWLECWAGGAVVTMPWPCCVSLTCTYEYALYREDTPIVAATLKLLASSASITELESPCMKTSSVFDRLYRPSITSVALDWLTGWLSLADWLANWLAG